MNKLIEANDRFTNLQTAISKTNGPALRKARNLLVYPAMMAFLATIESEALPNRAKVEAELAQEHQDFLTALAMEQEQAARAAERLKFNAIVGDLSKTLKSDLAQA
jgi:hypothetical protein